MRTTFGCFLSVAVILFIPEQPGNTDSALTETAKEPTVLKNSLLVCLLIILYSTLFKTFEKLQFLL